jgi:hypothetical protein
MSLVGTVQNEKRWTQFSFTAGQRSYRNALPYASLSGVVGTILPKTDYGIRLRAFLAFDYIELDLIAFFERFVPVQLNSRVVNEYIWPVFASDESVALGVVKPLHFPFVLSHSFLPSFSFSSGEYGETSGGILTDT